MVETKVYDGSTSTIEQHRKTLQGWREHYQKHDLLRKAQWSSFDEEMWYQARRAHLYLIRYDSSFRPYKPIIKPRQKFKLLPNGELKFYDL